MRAAVLGASRVAFWGALAMAITAGVGAWFGAVVRAGAGRAARSAPNRGVGKWAAQTPA